ncbi:phospholipid carrier-dependent glycosyltransferase [Patescibacteria group bacterium]
MISQIKNNKIVWLIILLTLAAAIIRFSALTTPTEIAGDEIYFVNFSRDYFDNQLYFDVHPPLGKLLIALGIGAFGDTPFSWRFFSAVFGTLLIPLFYWFGWIVFRRKLVGLFLALLVFFDGLFFVISRVGVMDAGMMFFLFLGYGLLFLATSRENLQPKYFLAAGLCLGLAISIKWLALVFLPIAILLFVLPEIYGWHQIKLPSLGRRLLYVLGYVILPAAGVYLLSWFIHFLIIGVGPSQMIRYFWIFNIKIFNYHTHITDVSPLMSPWWTWPWLWQPWEYFNSVSPSATRVISAVGTPLIWWSALLAFVPVVKKLFKQIKELLLVVIMLLVHWLPFALVNRPMFSYHFLISLPLFLLPLALLLTKLWQKNRLWRIVVISFLLLVAINFILFWPIWNAVPLSEDALQIRTWLPDWHRGP